MVFLSFQGASIIRMLESVITRENLQRGLRDYLNMYKFSNAETDDLWEALSKVNWPLFVVMTYIYLCPFIVKMDACMDCQFYFHSIHLYKSTNNSESIVLSFKRAMAQTRNSTNCNLQLKNASVISLNTKNRLSSRPVRSL